MRKRKPTPEDVLVWMEEYANGRAQDAGRIRVHSRQQAVVVEMETQLLWEWITHCRTRLKEDER